MTRTLESEPHLPPASSEVSYLASIKGVGHPSSASTEGPLVDHLHGSRLHHALLTTCQRLELSSLRAWDRSRKLLLDLVASAVRCSDATLVLDTPASPVEPTMLGWTANFEITVTDPMVTLEVLESVLAWSGLINGLEDWHPAYGRFSVVTLEESEPPTC